MKRAAIPPLGPRPKFVFDEERIKDLGDAICRYVQANCPIPHSWIDQYNELVNSLEKEEL